jgi:hypothetical protein
MAGASARWIALERDRDPSSQEILVLDARDGPLTVLFEGALAVSDTRVVWADAASGLHVLDAASGRALWHAAFRPWPSGGHVALAPDDRVAAWGPDGEVRVWSPTGAVLAHLTMPVDYGVAGLLWSAGTLVTCGSQTTRIDPGTSAVIETIHPEAGCLAVDVGGRLITLEGRELVARSVAPVAPVPLRGALPGWVHSGTTDAFVVTDDGIVEAYDVATGGLRYRISVGQPRMVWLYRPRSAVEIARGALRGQDVVVTVDRAGNLEARSLAVPVSPPPVVVVTGVVRVNRRALPGVTMSIGGRRVRSRAGGRFSTRVELEGPLQIRIEDDEIVRRARRPCARALEQIVEIPRDGTGRVRVTVDAFAYGYECNRACRCD